MNGNVIDIRVIAKDLASGAFNAVMKGANKLADTLTGGVKNAFSSLKNTISDVAKTAAGFLVGNLIQNTLGKLTGSVDDVVGKFKSFQSVMSNISTVISGDSTKQIADLTKGIEELTMTVPKTADELGAAAYDILSAGIQGTTAQLEVLKGASKLAVAGLGDTSGAVDLMTSSINAFGLDASKASEISDVLFKTVNYGKTTVDGLRQGFGSVAPAAAAAKVEFNELMAATSALTTTGLPASEAYTQLRALFNEMGKPTSALSGALKKMGYQNGVAAIKALGLQQTLELLRKSVGNNDIALKNLFGSTEAGSAALGLATTVNKAFNDINYEMLEGTNALESAFQKQTLTADNMAKVMQNKVDVSGRAVVSTFYEIMKSSGAFQLISHLLDEAAKFFQGFAAGVTEKMPQIQEAFGALGTKVGELLRVLGIIGPETKTAMENGKTAGNQFADTIIKLTGKATEFVQYLIDHKADIKKAFEDSRKIGEDFLGTLRSIKNTIEDVIKRFQEFQGFSNRLKNLNEQGGAASSWGPVALLNTIRAAQGMGGGHDGGIVKGFNTGGFVAGPRMGYGKDNIMVRAEEGEAILTEEQQGNIMNKLNNAGKSIVNNFYGYNSEQISTSINSQIKLGY